MSLTPRPLRLAALAMTLAGLALPTAAQASSGQLSIMQDDDLLLYRGDQVRDRTLLTMRNEGADAVRVTVLWSVIGQGANDTPAEHRRFNAIGAANPKAYPHGNWDRYDRLDRACQTLKVVCYFDVTGPGPEWTHPKPPPAHAKDAHWWKPDKRKFYSFVQAVGKRYSGAYHDDNDRRVVLPRVSFWSLWNEPNQGGWLRPQYIANKPVSPSLYRDLYMFGHRALASTGHGGDVILAGETAPINVPRKTTTSAMGPKIFINELFCGPGSDRLGCSSFSSSGPLQATAWAHHPYTKRNSPFAKDADAQAITLANIGDLGTELDTLANASQHLRAGLPIMATEFGYETNPPDPFAATTPDQQAQYVAQSDLLTFLDPRIVANSQFLLRDVKPDRTRRAGSRGYWSTYQSGLQTAGGTNKPSFTAYTMPFLIQLVGRAPDTGQPIVSIFGHLRFLPNNLSALNPTAVQIQWKPANGSSDYVSIGDPLPVTNTVGYYYAPQYLIPGPGLVRARWVGSLAPAGITSLPQPIQ